MPVGEIKISEVTRNATIPPGSSLIAVSAEDGLNYRLLLSDIATILGLVTDDNIGSYIDAPLAALNNGRVFYLDDATTVSAAVVPALTDFIITYHRATTTLKFWVPTTEPAGGIETPILAEDSSGRWWLMGYDTGDSVGGIIGLRSVAGTANAITATADVNNPAYTFKPGGVFAFTPFADNTAIDPTITINGITRVIKDVNGSDLIPASLKDNTSYIMQVIDDTTVRMVSTGMLANTVNLLGLVGDVGRAAGSGMLSDLSTPFRNDESARIEFRSGAIILRSGGSVVAYEAAQFGNQPIIPRDQYSINADGSFALVTSGKSRANSIGKDMFGGWFQPAVVQAWNLGMAGFTPTGVSVAPSAEQGCVEGSGGPVQFSAVSSGAGTRHASIQGMSTVAGEVYQIDAVVKMAAQAPFLSLRLPSGFSSPSAGGSGNGIVVDMVAADGRPISAAMTADPTVVRDLGDGWRHIRWRATCITAQSGQYFALVPNPSGSFSLSNTFAAGPLMQVEHFSIQRAPAPVMPVTPTGAGMTPVAIPATTLTVDMDKVGGSQRFGTIEVEFMLTDGVVENATIPIWRIDIGGTRGIGLDMVGRALRATIYAPSRVHVDITDLYSKKFRAAISYDGVRMNFSVNGETASIVTTQDMASIWETLRFGHDNPLAEGTAKAFSGVIAYWRFMPIPLTLLEMKTLTSEDFNPGPGEYSPIAIGDNGEAIISKDAKGRIDFVPGERAMEAISRGYAFDRSGIPDDAMGFTSFEDGLHFFTDAFGQRTHRMKKNNDGLIIGHRTDRRVHVIWGGGQSLAYGNVYLDPVTWDSTPYFFDVDDSLANSVFGYSALGNPSDRLTVPFISETIGGPGGFIYPAMNHAARDRAEKEASPIPIIAKTIGQSGARIRELWPWGIYDTGLDTGTPINVVTHWNNVRKWHQSVKDACERLDFVPYCPAFLWCQGTADENNGSYAANLDSSWASLNLLVNEFYGQSEGVPHFLLTQSGGRADTSENSWLVADIQLDWATNTPGAAILTPLYNPDLVLQDANVHPTYTSTTIFGEVCGWAMEEILAGRKWHIGRPVITTAGNTVTLDYSAYLRDDEELQINPDIWYSGVGIENVGLSIHSMISTTSGGVAARYAPATMSVVSVAVSPDGKSYVFTLTAPIGGALGYRIGYAAQFQDMTTADPLHFARRGLLTTTLSRPSKRLPGRTLRRWIPSFSQEVIY